MLGTPDIKNKLNNDALSGESDTRNNLLAYKYTRKKSTDFRPPRGLEDGSHSVRSSVRSFYKLYDALFACSTKMNVCSVRLTFKRTWL